MIFERGDRVIINELGEDIRGTVYSLCPSRIGDYLVVLDSAFAELQTRERRRFGRVLTTSFEHATGDECHRYHASRLRKLSLLDQIAEAARGPEDDE